MAIGAITMILTNVSLQIYNNWCGSRQNDKLQQKREEFERAARERNTEHMWKLLREGQELTMLLEKKKHDDRLKELKGDLDNLLKEITHEQTIVNWPLKVLPIVMKNQAFGNLLAKQEEKVAMHVLFARSNYNEFNKLVHPIIEKSLELHCNQHWSTKSDHPILFYSGAWDTQKCPMDPSDIQINALQTQLSNLPTLLITPFFRHKDGKLIFHINMWGVGASNSDTFYVKEIEPKCDELHFQRTYTNQQNYEKEIGLLNEIVEDLVPYLECMIGYMADTYFWSSAGLAPHLPMLLTSGTINTDGMKYLFSDSQDFYDNLLVTSEQNLKKNPFIKDNLLRLYDGSSSLWNGQRQTEVLRCIFLDYCEREYGQRYDSVLEATKGCPFSRRDEFFITYYLNLSDDKFVAKNLWKKPYFNQYYSLSNDETTLIPHIHFIGRDKLKNEMYYTIKVDVYDILDTLENFKSFILENKNRIPIDDPSLYIEVVGYSMFLFHIYDPDTQKILVMTSGFDYKIECKRIRHQKQIKSLFKYNEHASIICRQSRIEKLINYFNDNNLIY